MTVHDTYTHWCGKTAIFPTSFRCHFLQPVGFMMTTSRNVYRTPCQKRLHTTPTHGGVAASRKILLSSPSIDTSRLLTYIRRYSKCYMQRPGPKGGPLFILCRGRQNCVGEIKQSACMSAYCIHTYIYIYTCIHIHPIDPPITILKIYHTNQKRYFLFCRWLLCFLLCLRVVLFSRLLRLYAVEPTDLGRDAAEPPRK